jgi:integrase
MPRVAKPWRVFQRNKHKEKTGDCIYYVQYRDPVTGKRTTPKSTGQLTKKAAETWAERHQTDFNAPKSEVIKFLSGLYEEGSEYFLHTIERKPISSTQLAHNRAKLKNYIIPALEIQGIKYFSQLDIQVLEKAQEIVKKQVSSKTMNEAFLVFRKALDWAAKKKMLNHDPFQGYEPYVHHRRARGMLTKEEVLKLWNLDLPDQTRLLVFIPLFCGLRIGEMQALRVESFLEDRICISESYEIRAGFKGPKGSTEDLIKSRYTCLPTSIHKIEKRLAEGKKDQDLVFPPVRTARILTNDHISKAVYAALASIGISEEERKSRYLGNHSSRYFFNSFLLNNNINIYEVQHSLGHSGKALDTNPMTAQYFSPLTDFPKINKLFDDFVATPL